MTNISTEEEVAIYIHWPFCKSKCPYCDFNSHVRTNIDQSRWHEAYLHEISSYQHFLQGKRITSIFFGGGTPSLTSPSFIGAIIDALAPGADIEITLEANPTSVEATKFRDYKSAGVNRISIGVQSFRSEHLAFLGREHTSDEAIKAIELAKQHFSRYSFDLIYMLPNQSLAAWEKELCEALRLANGHMSLYQLTIEKGTKFFAMHRDKEFVLPNDDDAADAYLLTNAIMEEHGLPYYEVSNYAAPGQECRHNLTYWRYGDYIGIGPGAHGRYTLRKYTGNGHYPSHSSRVATISHYSPEEWLQAVAEHGHGKRSCDLLSQKQTYEERILMGMRTREGLEVSLLKEPEKIITLVEQGMITCTDGRIRATEQGLLLLNSVISKLL